MTSTSSASLRKTAGKPRDAWRIRLRTLRGSLSDNPSRSSVCPTLRRKCCRRRTPVPRPELTARASAAELACIGFVGICRGTGSYRWPNRFAPETFEIVITHSCGEKRLGYCRRWLPPGKDGRSVPADLRAVHFGGAGYVVGPCALLIRLV
jgi:hypothetical protein